MSIFVVCVYQGEGFVLVDSRYSVSNGESYTAEKWRMTDDGTLVVAAAVNAPSVLATWQVFLNSASDGDLVDRLGLLHGFMSEVSYRYSVVAIKANERLVQVAEANEAEVLPHAVEEFLLLSDGTGRDHMTGSCDWGAIRSALEDLMLNGQVADAATMLRNYLERVVLPAEPTTGPPIRVWRFGRDGMILMPDCDPSDNSGGSTG